LLVSLDKQGQKRWEIRFAGEHSYILSRVLADDGSIYVMQSQARFNFNTSSYVWNVVKIADDGAVKWNFTQSGAISAEVLGDAFIATCERLPGSDKKCDTNTLHRLAEDGSILWNATLSGENWKSAMVVPMVTKDAAYVSLGGAIHALSLDGNELWAVSLCPVGFSSIRCSVTAPVLAEDGTIYTTAMGKLYALSQGGVIKRSFQTVRRAAENSGALPLAVVGFEVGSSVFVHNYHSGRYEYESILQAVDVSDGLQSVIEVL